MTAAIEIYNKPGISYRNESFAILAINAWELLLKAKWLELHQHKRRSLYVYEHRITSTGKKTKKRFIKRTRSNAPFTHDIGYLGKKLVNRRLLDSSVFRNIEIMLEFRDCATHFYNVNPDFSNRLHEIGAACVRNFVNLFREWFAQDITKFNLHLMPIAVMTLPSGFRGLLLNSEESNFLAFMDSVDEPNSDPESPYSVSVNVGLKFTRSKSNDAVAVQVTRDPSAMPVKLTEENIRERYPWDYAKLTDKCRQRYKDFKLNQQYHHIRKRLETDDRFASCRYLDPGNPKSATKTFFNPNIMVELDNYYTKEVSEP